MKIFILAAGESTRWKLDYPKHIAKIQNVPLIERTQKQLKGYDVTVVTTHLDVQKLSDKTLVPKARRWTVETLLSTASYWDDRKTIILLGDVVYSPAAIKTILKDDHAIRIFGNGKEIFAISMKKQVYKKAVDTLWECVLRALGERSSHKTKSEQVGKLWDFYRLYAGHKQRKYLDDNFFTCINDYTEDIDSVNDYNNLFNITEND